MPWPQKIQLHDSHHSHSYDGSEVTETFYIEPADADTAFIASMLGRVDNLNRTLPAQHFKYSWCYAMDCNVVPFDPRQFSYMGTTNLTPYVEGQTMAQNIGRIKDAAETFDDIHLNPRADISYKFMSGPTPAVTTTGDNDAYSAGVFITVTYMPVIGIPSNSSNPAQFIPDFDCINWTFIPQIRTNQVNKGLSLICPPGIGRVVLDPFGIGNIIHAWMPDACIAPVLKEEYQEMVMERRMLSPIFDISAFSNYVGKTNWSNAGFIQFSSTTINGLEVTFPSRFYNGTLKFTQFDTNYVQVPQVDLNGDPHGYNNWLNLKIHIDWRTIGGTTGVQIVDDTGAAQPTLPVFDYDSNGFFSVPKLGTPITWNHVLAYPGIFFEPDGLAWYRAKFTTGIMAGLGVAGSKLYDPFPMISNFTDIWTKIF